MARLEERREQLARQVEASLADEREAVAHDKRQLREKAEVFRVKMSDIESRLEREREAVSPASTAAPPPKLVSCRSCTPALVSNCGGAGHVATSSVDAAPKTAPLSWRRW